MIKAFEILQDQRTSQPMNHRIYPNDFYGREMYSNTTQICHLKFPMAKQPTALTGFVKILNRFESKIKLDSSRDSQRKKAFVVNNKSNAKQQTISGNGFPFASVDFLKYHE